MCTNSDHAKMKRDPAIWQTLEPIGVQVLEAMRINGVDLPEERIELRNCRTCHSTLAIEVL